ncbi:uncharacterized protein MELLADRAFT_61077 [Melampsora larici-populina 98AG31]|uniref:MYND-type domain-containing protein n=1 Tax=Melampsora larici-populina (strain 98AG31 / pathotype 3-4-7) TaxID=747676 RepID=F4RDI3_MELLP|nr:uncharacterized protein MELLADRAFT_61077 [Melampsora larici-populina 98AG31]EGG09604.1 hypothetical protein MELLADRAFT_61077 [Melampsora larici-populina 98AG31]
MFHSSVSSNPQVPLNCNLQNQAVQLHKDGQYEKEEVALLNALERKIATSGAQSHTVALTKNSLGELYIDMGRLNEAQKFLEEAEIVRKDGAVSDLVCTRDNLGRLYEMKGDHEKAIKWRTMGAPNEMVCSHYQCPKMINAAKLSKYAELQHCARCKCVFYCGTVCQKKDWTRHKKYCQAPTSTVAPVRL